MGTMIVSFLYPAPGRCINIFQKQLCGLFQMAVMDLFLIRRIKLISFAGFWNFFREIGKANEYAVAKMRTTLHWRYADGVAARATVVEKKLRRRW